MGRSIHRETAAAFGDPMDRDAQAEFGAALGFNISTATSGKPTVAVKLPVAAKPAAVKLPAGAAPKAPAPKPVNVSLAKAPVLPKAATAKPAVKVTAPAVSVNASALKAAVLKLKPAAPVLKTTSAQSVYAVAPPAPKPTSSAKSLDADISAMLSPGGKAMPAPKLPDSVKPTEKDKAIAAQAKVTADARATANRNLAYNAQRAKEEKEKREREAWLLADPGPEGQAHRAYLKKIGSAGLDLDIFVKGAAVLATGAAVIATAGAAAGAVGLTAGGASLATAAAADRLVAATEKAGAVAKQAKAVVADVKSAAAKGDAIAKQAEKAINAVTDERALKGVADGALQPLTDAAKQAVGKVEALGSTLGVGVSGSASVSTGELAAGLRALATDPARGTRQPVRPNAAIAAVFDNIERAQMEPITRKTAPALASFDLGVARPRWLVTSAGRVVDIDLTPAAVNGAGIVVWSNGKVVKQ